MKVLLAGQLEPYPPELHPHQTFNSTTDTQLLAFYLYRTINKRVDIQYLRSKCLSISPTPTVSRVKSSLVRTLLFIICSSSSGEISTNTLSITQAWCRNMVLHGALVFPRSGHQEEKPRITQTQDNTWPPSDGWVSSRDPHYPSLLH